MNYYVNLEEIKTILEDALKIREHNGRDPVLDKLKGVIIHLNLVLEDQSQLREDLGEIKDQIKEAFTLGDIRTDKVLQEMKRALEIIESILAEL